MMSCHMKKKCPLAAKHVQPLPCACKKHYMHTHCSHLLLDRYEIEAEDRPTDPSITFCTKGCHTKWNGDKIRAAKAADKAASDAAKPPKKVPWDSDGTLDFLMDWITTEPNYALYCGCNGNKGKSKAQHHKELSIEMKKELPGTDRSEKCIEGKIQSFESKFRKARDWTNATGAGVENQEDFWAYVLKMCPFYEIK